MARWERSLDASVARRLALSLNEGRIHSMIFTPADLFGVVNEPLNDIFEDADAVDIENI
jgi:hypothetical protein